MNNYVTGTTIKRLREKSCMTQAELAEKINVSSKTVSKWKTAKGLLDITLIEPLAGALGVSVMELMSGNTVINGNVSTNMLRSEFYACSVCGNVIHACGCAAISCCGITLMPLEAEMCDDEHFLTVRHDMTKQHYISFIAFLSADRYHIVKLYPEGNAQTRMNICGGGYVYFYCNKYGLFKKKI